MANVESSLLNLGLCLAMSLPSSFPTGQSAPSSSQPSKAASRSETSTSKLNSEQERGLRLLNAAVAESTGLQPNMHAFVLWRASYAYTKLNSKRAEKLTRDAFMATLSIDDPPESDRCGAPGSAGDIKSWIQQRALYDMVHRDQLRAVEQLLPQAPPTVRNEITAELVRYYESKKDPQHAETLLSTLADSDRYPFGVAANLFTAFGPESSADRINIFNQALNNYERHAAPTTFGSDDIATFIESTWKAVPPGLALEAIQKVLDATKENDSESSYSITSAHGSIVLSSTYALRLFQLLPILQNLDSEEAEALLRDQTNVAEQLKAYPGGMQSLQSQNTNLSYGLGGGGPSVGNAAASQQMSAQMRDRVGNVLARTDADPAGALATALMLPVHGAFERSSPRSDALLGIAEKAAAKKPSVSRSALDEFSTIQDQLTPQEMTGIDRLPELYLKIGDIDGAKKAIDILVKAAGKLYEHDTDTDDPNTAFKGSWPSTDLWGKAIRVAAKVSPALAEGIIAGVQDAEIAAFEKVAFGTALVGGAKMDAPVLVADCRKHSASFRRSSSN